MDSPTPTLWSANGLFGCGPHTIVAGSNVHRPATTVQLLEFWIQGLVSISGPIYPFWLAHPHVLNQSVPQSSRGQIRSLL